MPRLLTFPLRLLWSVVVILTPLIAVWCASSLTAYHNGPIWAVCLSGALLFPILPMLWELRASVKWERGARAREAKQQERGKRWLKLWDRLVLRTLVLNVLFLATLLAIFPKEGFTALATRGDWMLAGNQTAEADVTREALFEGASKLEWLYALASDNPYERFDDGESSRITPAPNPLPLPTAPDPVAKNDPSKNEPDTAVTPPTIAPAPKAPTTREPGEPPPWPMLEELHPLVRAIPEDQQQDYASVARYIAAHESDPFQRVKALHDYVANRIAYDAPALRAGQYPPQDAETVFNTRKAVCAGYATLLVEMSRYTGDEMVYVTGESRDMGGNIGGGGHAWNAVKIEGRWYLLDATWDAGTVEGSAFKKSYSTAYLFTPPTAFILDHFPENDAWQLLPQPVTRGDFMRYPVLKPEFFAKGLELVSPQRSQIDVQGSEVVVELINHRHTDLMANLVPKGQLGSSGQRCEIRGKEKMTVSCKLPGQGTYQVWLFAKDKGTMYPFVGQIEVNAK